MLNFGPFDLNRKEEYNRFLLDCGVRGCEYNLANLYMWGEQQVLQLPDGLAFFSNFNGKRVYPFPLCKSGLEDALNSILEDAGQRGIPCNLTGLQEQECQLLDRLYPGRFTFGAGEDMSDYVYRIEDLGELKGRKYQKKRNHLNKFKLTHPDCRVEPITEENLPQVRSMVSRWYEIHQQANPEMDYSMEMVAMERAFCSGRQLGIEGILLRNEGEILAMTMGSPLSCQSFDVHFEKAVDESAYVAVNYFFAGYLRDKYPQLQWLNREEDMGIAGLRQAKQSYNPDHRIVKWWAKPREEIHEI